MSSGFRGLTILLGILLLCSVLSGQQAAIRLGGRHLELPANWEVRYGPSEVSLRVLVQPDSTLYLLQVLDGKDELTSLVREHLNTYKYLLQADSLGTAKELDVILEIDQQPITQVNLVSNEILLQQIETWISDRKSELSFREPIHNAVQRPIAGFAPAPYTAGYLSYTLSDAALPVSLQGFLQQSSYFGSSVYAQYYHPTQHLDVTPFGVDYGTLRYPYAITIADIQAGLGDYEHRFAKGSLKKNDLFGVKSLYLDFDFLAQGGYWLEQNSSVSALKGFLSVPLGATSLELEVADYSSVLSMLQLKPEYWTFTNFPIKHKYKQYYAAWKNPWLNIALLGTTESATADEFLQTLHNNLIRLQAYNSLKLGSMSIDGLYERKLSTNDTDLDYGTYTDLARLGLRYSGALINAETQAKMYDFERVLLEGELNMQVGSFAIEPFASFNLNDSSAQTQVASIYEDDDWFYRFDFRRDHDLGFRVNYRPAQSTQALLTLGKKQITETSMITIPPTNKASYTDSRIDISQTNSVYYASLGAELNKTLRKWSVDWKPKLTLQSRVEYLQEEPTLEYQSNFNLQRDLGYGNALFAGFSVLGHSGYTSADQTAFAVETSAIADVWAGVQITNRFELTVTFKNITDSNIYGVYPIPRSLHASLRWFFLN